MMQYPWLAVGVKVTPINRTPFAWEQFLFWKADFWRAMREGDPKLGSVYQVSEILRNARGIVFIRLEGFTLAYTLHSFRPVLPNTTEAVEAMRRSMRDAVQRGETVDA